MHKTQIVNRLELLHKAIISIDEWRSEYESHTTLLSRDGLVQRFEYTTELLRKTCKKILRYQLIDVIDNPMEVIKTSARVWIISNPEDFFILVKIRNQFSHNYDADRSNILFEELITLKDYYRTTYQELKDFIDKIS